MRTPKQTDINIQAMIDKSVARAYAHIAYIDGVLPNHTQVTLPAASTTAITGTSGGATQLESVALTPNVTGKFRITVQAGVLSGDTVSHQFNFTIATANGTHALVTFFTSPTVATAGNNTGMTLVSWTIDTTAIGTVGVAQNFAFYAYGNNTTSLSVPGGDAQLNVQEIF